MSMKDTISFDNLGSANNSEKVQPKTYINQAYPDNEEIKMHLKAIEKILEANPQLVEGMTTLPYGSGLDTMKEVKLQGSPDWQKVLIRKNKFLAASNKFAEGVKAGTTKFFPVLTFIRRVNDTVEEAETADEFSF